MEYESVALVRCKPKLRKTWVLFKELDEMMKRLKEIEDGVAAPREMQVKVEKEWNKALKYYKCRRPRSLKAFSVLFSSHYYMRTMTI
uniref:Uncharacterized protein isoform X5 n=1 Tax=Nicotiana tabacum TaxID=4097 RepID=A0A1S3YW56_TOBAC|nr:PREDICTED: uncharacterized protein LOC107780518 isoform X5 [Nicotiana tabacum]